MTGLLNKKYESNNRGFITQSDDIANLGLIDNYEIKMEGEKGNRTYIACNKKEKRMFGDLCGIYHDIISGGYLKNFETIDEIKKQSKDFVVCGVKTDCLMVKSNDLIEFNDLGNSLKNVIKQGIKVEDFKELNYEFKRGYRKPLGSYFNNKYWIKMKNLELISFLFN